VARDAYVGRPFGDVQSDLEGLGLSVTLVEGDAADSEDKVGLVYDLNPTGNVAKGTAVKVTYYAAMAEIPAPATPTKTAPTGDPAPGDSITVGWTRFEGCPAGTSLSGYTINIGGASASNGSFSATAGATNYEFKAGPDAGDITVNYVAYCGSRNSPASGDLVITTVAPDKQPPAEQPPANPVVPPAG
jgi:serine/threonine-protein kinase